MKIYKLKDYNTDINDFLAMTDEENYFNIYSTWKDEYIYNLNSSIYFDIDDKLLDIHILNCNMHWPLISYNIYGTTRLTWLLLKINDIKGSDIFKIKMAGDKIKFLPKENIEPLIKNINGYA